MTKLPKQWKHWLSINGFKWAKRTRYGHLNPVKAGRRYRVTCVLDPETLKPRRDTDPGIRFFQIDDGGEFDRWANSKGAEVPLPRTHAEFKEAVAKLTSLCQLENAK